MYGIIYIGGKDGYTILRRIKDNCFENVLGVTKQGIAGKTAAIPLYLGTLDFIESQGGRKYIGMVSSTNMASLNLHMQLGAKVTGIFDKYILRKASKSSNEPL